MKTRYISVALWFLIICSINTNIFCQPCKEVIGYYPNWQWYDRNKLVNPASIKYNRYTIINYCFFKPEASGLVSSTDSWADENLLQGQINWQTNPPSHYPNTSIIDLAHNANTKVLVSIGGWTLSDNFPQIAADPQKRAVFAGECNRLLQFYNFDGIDIDWEYPGYADHQGTANDKINFTLFLQQIKDSITSLGQINGKNYLLSACFGASQAHASNIEWNQIHNIVDMINLMTYDFFGAFDGIANHNSPLYAPASGDSTFNLNSAFYLLTNTYQVPASKINLGVAFYGRSQTGATALHQPTSGQADVATFSADEGSPLYFNIAANMSLFSNYWDNLAKVPYLLGNSGTSASGTFVSYDNPESIALKAKYINDHGAKGAIIWEITGDYIETATGSGIVGQTPLADTLNYVFCHPDVTGIENFENRYNNMIAFPNPVSDIITVLLPFEIPLNAKLQVFDVHGKIVFEEAPVSINKGGTFYVNTESWKNGIYEMRICGIKNQSGMRLIKCK